MVGAYELCLIYTTLAEGKKALKARSCNLVSITGCFATAYVCFVHFCGMNVHVECCMVVVLLRFDLHKVHAQGCAVHLKVLCTREYACVLWCLCLCVFDV